MQAREEAGSLLFHVEGPVLGRRLATAVAEAAALESGVVDGRALGTLNWFVEERKSQLARHRQVAAAARPGAYVRATCGGAYGQNGLPELGANESWVSRARNVGIGLGLNPVGAVRGRVVVGTLA